LRWPRRRRGRSLQALLDERLARREVKDIQSGFKNPDRFDQWIALLQSRVPWDEQLVLPLGEGLYVVRIAAGEYGIRTEAGTDLCDWRENWKLHARVFVRKTLDDLREIYPERAHCDPDWMELREYYDPADGTLLEVEALPPGYPVVHEFLPDLGGFYAGWLGRELP
jgi:acetone carboxylase gamma subunit